jgi:lipopolysaccharide export system ATP-binding protein
VISIAKSYDKRAVLTDISLTVAKGEVLGLLGPNGAGKTTCFYSIMGLVKPDSGRILMDGVDVTKLPMYRRAILGLGYLPQETSIFRGMTVEQNINCVLELVEPDKATRAAELERLLEEFGLTRLREAPAMALSGGERRRCEIARALAAKPSIMLLDEPFAGIDPLSISDIRDLVKDLKQRGIGVLITDHNVRETLDIVDRACIIYGGQVLFAGSPAGTGRGRERAPALSRRELHALGRMDRHGAGPAPRPPADAIAGDDAAVAAGDQAAGGCRTSRSRPSSARRWRPIRCSMHRRIPRTSEPERIEAPPRRGRGGDRRSADAGGRGEADAPLDIDPDALDRDRDTGDWSAPPMRDAEWGAAGGSGPDFDDARCARRTTLAEHLEAQVGALASDPRTAFIARHIIGLLDEAGYLPPRCARWPTISASIWPRPKRRSTWSSRSIPPGVGARTWPNASRCRRARPTATIRACRC